MNEFKTSPKCPACGQKTLGIYNTAKDLLKKLERKRLLQESENNENENENENGNKNKNKNENEDEDESGDDGEA